MMWLWHLLVSCVLHSSDQSNDSNSGLFLQDQSLILMLLYTCYSLHVHEHHCDAIAMY